MLDQINVVVKALVDGIYTPWIPLLLIGAGLYFTLRTGFIQIRCLFESFRVILEKPKNAKGVSSFGALMVSTAARVGTGNIIGVSQALCVGGMGALFWMWIIAFCGGASAYVESTLAQIYKRRNPDGTFYGGPSYYIEAVLKSRWLGLIFACTVILTYTVGYNMLGAFNMQSTLSGFSFYNSWTPCITGVILAVLFGATVLSGSHILITVTGLLVPFMSLMYIAVGLYIVGINYQNIPAMFSGIFADAFNFHAIFGGFSGSCLMYGVKRGLFSNEAGMGSAPNAAASADVSHPVKQGLVQMLSVFIDTLVLCTVTALMCLSTGIVPTAELAGAPYVQQTMHTALGDFGPIFIVVALSLFVFTTLIGNYYYSEGCLSYIMKGTPSRRFMTVFRLCASVLVLVGAMLSMELAWNTVDLTQALMVLINVPVIFLLARPAVAALRDYLRQRREGLDPHFHSEDIQLEGKTECWEREEG